MNAARQRGVTLLIALFLLIALTILGIAAYNSSALNQKVVGNAQFRTEIEGRAQQAVEQVVNDYTKFQTPTATTTTSSTTSVTTQAPTCVSAEPSPGESQVLSSASAAPTASGTTTAALMTDTNWRITATVTDSNTGSVATVSQGVKIRANDLACP